MDAEDFKSVYVTKDQCITPVANYTYDTLTASHIAIKTDTHSLYNKILVNPQGTAIFITSDINNVTEIEYLTVSTLTMRFENVKKAVTSFGKSVEILLNKQYSKGLFSLLSGCDLYALDIYECNILLLVRNFRK